MIIGAATSYGIGVGIQWTTLWANGALDPSRRQEGSPGLVIPMVGSSIVMVYSTFFSALAGKELGKKHRDSGRDHLAKPLRTSGGVLLGLGLGAAAGTTMFWPSIRKRCPIALGCNLAALQASSASVTVGAGMLSYANTLAPPERSRPSRDLSKARAPLIVGGTLVAGGYFGSAFVGLLGWQNDPDDPRNLRIRNRMLIPVVGPWIVAAGPDAPLFFAMLTGALGAMQISGSAAMVVGGAKIGRYHYRARHRSKPQAFVTLAPRLDGFALVGRF